MPALVLFLFIMFQLCVTDQLLKVLRSAHQYLDSEKEHTTYTHAQ